MDMNLLIYVLFLSICDTAQNYEENTTEMTNATENETTFTTIEAKTNESTWIQMDVSQKSILFIGIVAFMLYSSLYLHCFDLLKLWRTEASKEEKANKYALGSSKTALSNIKTSNLDGEETQPMQSNSVKLSGDSNPEKTLMLNTTEKTIKSISRERESMPEKTLMLSTTEKSNKSISRESESMPTGAKKLSQSPQKEMLFEQSKQKKKFNSTPDQRKSKTHCQGNSPHSHTVIKEIYSSYPSRIIKTPGSSNLDNQCKQNVTSSARDSFDHYFSCTLQKMMTTFEYNDLHTPETHKCPKHPLSNSCQCHKETCLICMTSEYVINEDFEANYKVSPFSKKMSFSRSFDRIESQDCIINDKMSSSDEVKIENDNSDDDSEKEITIFSNIAYEKGILENTQNYRLNRNRNHCEESNMLTF